MLYARTHARLSVAHTCDEPEMWTSAQASDRTVNPTNLHMGISKTIPLQRQDARPFALGPHRPQSRSCGVRAFNGKQKLG